ncbi:MAG: histidine kinase [Burkholderiaceae bacterium]
MPPTPPYALPAVAADATRTRWRRLGRSALYMTLLCTGIALLLTVMDRGGLGVKLVYSFSIGACCWLIIDGGRNAAAHLLARLRVARGLGAGDRPGFPGWPMLGLLVLLGMVLGPMAGLAIADLLTGHRSPALFAIGSTSGQVTLVISIFATLASLFTFTLLERLSSARAEAEAARRSAAEHRLKLLESQLEPHMLFNTLANLRVLITLDPPRAQAMLDRLIGYLRSTLGASRATLHPLADEFERLRDYLALMQVRMGDRLGVRLDLPADLGAVPVPALLLQPLVENCIRHGLEPQVGGGRIEVSAARDGTQLRLTVRDTGVGLAPAGTGADVATGTGFGLQQVRERLAALYGDAARLELAPADDTEGGAQACIHLPIRGTPT